MRHECRNLPAAQHLCKSHDIVQVVQQNVVAIAGLVPLRPWGRGDMSPLDPSPIRWCWCPDTGCRAVGEVTDTSHASSTSGPVTVVTVWCGAGHWFRLPLDNVIEMPD